MLKDALKRIANRFGLEVRRTRGPWPGGRVGPGLSPEPGAARPGRATYGATGRPVPPELLGELDPVEKEILWQVEDYTLTSPERIVTLIRATRYLVRAGIPGAFVECGVWRGGSMMAAALTLLAERDTSRDLYLFDTFEGMPAPTEKDRDMAGNSARSLLAGTPARTGLWCYAALDDVWENLRRSGYPAGKVHLVKGRVEETLPHPDLSGLALVRLDTDWYESTYHELHHLFPALTVGGVLMLDDYGHWQGAREAADRYFAENPRPPVYLHRVDYTCRVAIKCQG